MTKRWLEMSAVSSVLAVCGVLAFGSTSRGESQVAAASVPVLASTHDGQAQEAEQREASSREHAVQARRIEGVWAVTATIRDCQTGDPIPGVPLVRARNMFIRGGTL